jgi:hypothetical protein
MKKLLRYWWVLVIGLMVLPRGAADAAVARGQQRSRLFEWDRPFEWELPTDLALPAVLNKPHWKRQYEWVGSSNWRVGCEEYAAVQGSHTRPWTFNPVWIIEVRLGPLRIRTYRHLPDFSPKYGLGAGMCIFED